MLHRERGKIKIYKSTILPVFFNECEASDYRMEVLEDEKLMDIFEHKRGEV